MGDMAMASAMDTMEDMDTMARGRLRPRLSPTTDMGMVLAMAMDSMEDMEDLDTMARGKLRLIPTSMEDMALAIMESMVDMPVSPLLPLWPLLAMPPLLSLLDLAMLLLAAILPTLLELSMWPRGRLRPSPTMDMGMALDIMEDTMEDMATMELDSTARGRLRLSPTMALAMVESAMAMEDMDTMDTSAMASRGLL